jgi:hypothetical protein
MDNLKGIWEHELEWLDFLQRDFANSTRDLDQITYNQSIEKSLEYLKHTVFCEDLSWSHENGALRCTCKHNDAERLQYLNEILSVFKLREKNA